MLQKDIISNRILSTTAHTRTIYSMRLAYKKWPYQMFSNQPNTISTKNSQRIPPFKAGLGSIWTWSFSLLKTLQPGMENKWYWHNYDAKNFFSCKISRMVSLRKWSQKNFIKRKRNTKCYCFKNFETIFIIQLTLKLREKIVLPKRS